MPDFVADLGNSRLKVARVGALDGGLPALLDYRAFSLHSPSEWDALAAWIGQKTATAPTRWSIASVNPPDAERLRALLESAGPESLRWYTSAADVPVENRLERPEATGADRALAVLAARGFGIEGAWGLVVSCGTAITIERVLEDGTWEGGVIAPGLSLGARSLGRETALLPTVRLDRPAPSWGRSTNPAIAAGVFWGTVGAVRELIRRQCESRPDPWIVWTGGDAERLSREVVAASPVICPDLVLRGLAILVTRDAAEGRTP